MQRIFLAKVHLFVHVVPLKTCYCQTTTPDARNAPQDLRSHLYIDLKVYVHSAHCPRMKFQSCVINVFQKCCLRRHSSMRTDVHQRFRPTAQITKKLQINSTITMRGSYMSLVLCDMYINRSPHPTVYTKGEVSPAPPRFGSSRGGVRCGSEGRLRGGGRVQGARLRLWTLTRAFFAELPG